MIPKKDMIAALYGASRLLFFESQGMTYFRADKRAARHSFLVPVIAFPLLVLFLSFLRDTGPMSELPRHSFIMAYVAGLFFGIGVFYLLTHIVMEILYRDKLVHFPRFVTVFNWSFAVQTFLLALPILIHLVGLMSAQMTSAALLTLSFMFYAYKWFIIKLSLDIHWGWSIGLVIVQSALGDFFTIMTFATILRGSGVG